MAKGEAQRIKDDKQFMTRKATFTQVGCLVLVVGRNAAFAQWQTLWGLAYFSHVQHRAIA